MEFDVSLQHVIWGVICGIVLVAIVNIKIMGAKLDNYEIKLKNFLKLYSPLKVM